MSGLLLFSASHHIQIIIFYPASRLGSLPPPPPPLFLLLLLLLLLSSSRLIKSNLTNGSKLEAEDSIELSLAKEIIILEQHLYRPPHIHNDDKMKRYLVQRVLDIWSDPVTGSDDSDVSSDIKICQRSGPVTGELLQPHAVIRFKIVSYIMQVLFIYTFVVSFVFLSLSLSSSLSLCLFLCVFLSSYFSLPLSISPCFLFFSLAFYLWY